MNDILCFFHRLSGHAERSFEKPVEFCSPKFRKSSPLNFQKTATFLSEKEVAGIIPTDNRVRQPCRHLLP